MNAIVHFHACRDGFVKAICFSAGIRHVVAKSGVDAVNRCVTVEAMNEPVHRQETDKEETNLKDENEMLKEEIRRLKGLDVRDEKFLEENGQMCM